MILCDRFHDSTRAYQGAGGGASEGLITALDVGSSKVSALIAQKSDDGQLVVLGGLIEDTEGDGVDKVRGLGDIPVLGALFRSRSKTLNKTELLVFITPQVLVDTRLQP